MRQLGSKPLKCSQSVAADALIALVRLLARQAAREFAAEGQAPSDSKQSEPGIGDDRRAGISARRRDRAFVGVSLRTVRRWIAEKWLPSVKLGGVRLVSRKELERMLPPAPQAELED